MHKYYNPNPDAARVGDCTVRAISKVLNQDWEQTYIDLCLYGLIGFDMPSSNAVWGRYLRHKGFCRHVVPDVCPACYTVQDFAREHQEGIYLLALNGHVVAVINGDWYDTWDSGKEIPVYYWKKEA